ncbi:MAG: hypothetical protein BM557_09545 [Flavobacterium sp. MedPE-SWcel]|uniref:hypothetical protein n=1 Tax=uncultured Flavobacterium sp. TaxID=165435 RepID=UPI0009236AEE|nr:hypothetical protein [uncultured Flavobacterium sp.]OIQ16548.1 MAG: hypothetical protein BM557_09545 [Flavobacterium sp. MedPE-SWcel]
MSTEKEIAILLKDTLQADAEFTAVMDDKVFPLYGSQGVSYPFVVYRINDAEPISKDGGESYGVDIMLCFDESKYSACLDFKNVVRGILSSTPFSFERSEVAVDEETESIVCTMEYSIINF